MSAQRRPWPPRAGSRRGLRSCVIPGMRAGSNELPLVQTGPWASQEVGGPTWQAHCLEPAGSTAMAVVSRKASCGSCYGSWA